MQITSQCDIDNPIIQYFSRFGSITFNKCEARFLQPQLKLYSLYHVLRALKNELIGIQNFVMKVDAKYIKGMLKNPDIDPSVSINRWIIAILTFYFDLVHVPAAFHSPNGLSRCRLQPNGKPEPEDKDFDDWIDCLHRFIHFINPIKPKPL